MILISKAIVIVLLFILIGPPVLTYQWLRYQKSEIRHTIKKKMKDGLQEDEMVKLFFSKSEIAKKLRWEHDAEFEYREEMYDVIRREEKGDSIIFYCWWDHKETLLNQKLKHWLEDSCQHNDQRKQSSEKLLDFYQLLFCYGISDLSHHILNSDSRFFSVYIFSLNDVWMPTYIPPPQMV